MSGASDWTALPQGEAMVTERGGLILGAFSSVERPGRFRAEVGGRRLPGFHGSMAAAQRAVDAQEPGRGPWQRPIRQIRAGRRPRAGECFVVMAHHPNPYDTPNCPSHDAGPMVHPRLLVSAGAVRRQRRALASPHGAARCYVAAYLGERATDQASLFRALWRLRLSHLDGLELGVEGWAPATAGVLRYLDGQADALECHDDRSATP